MIKAQYSITITETLSVLMYALIHTKSVTCKKCHYVKMLRSTYISELKFTLEEAIMAQTGSIVIALLFLYHQRKIRGG